MTAIATVDLPQPDSPTSPYASPAPMSNETSSITRSAVPRRR
jgi:hypothetical protein